MGDWTKEPWQTKSDYLLDDRCTIIANVDGEIHADGTTSSYYDTVAICGDEFGEQMSPANAARIVACVNALEGIPNPAAIADVVEALHETLAELAEFDAILINGVRDERIGGIVDRAKAALAKLAVQS